MFADTVAAEAVPAAQRTHADRRESGDQGRWRGVELLTSGLPFLEAPDDGTRRPSGRVLIPCGRPPYVRRGPFLAGRVVRASGGGGATGWLLKRPRARGRTRREGGHLRRTAPAAANLRARARHTRRVDGDPGARCALRRLPHRGGRRPRRHGRRLPGDRAGARAPGGAEADRRRPRGRPGVPRALRARVAARGGDRPSERRARVRRGRGGRRSSTSSCATSRAPTCTAAQPRGPAARPARGGDRRPGRGRRSTPRTPPGSCTATSSRPTSCISGGDHVYLSDFGLTRRSTPNPADRDRPVDRDGRLHVARAAPGSASTRAPTSMRSAACSTRRSRATPRSRARTVPATIARAPRRAPPPRPSPRPACRAAFDARDGARAGQGPGGPLSVRRRPGRAAVAAARGEPVDRRAGRRAGPGRARRGRDGRGAPGGDERQRRRGDVARARAAGRRSRRGRGHVPRAGAVGGEDATSLVRGRRGGAGEQEDATALVRGRPGAAGDDATALVPGRAAAAGADEATATSAGRGRGRRGGRRGRGERCRGAPGGRRRRAASACAPARGRVGLLVLALAGAGALVSALAGGGPSTSSTAPLSADDVRGAAQDFAAAYGDEDPGALRAVLARDVRRVTPDGVQQGRTAVTAVYRRAVRRRRRPRLRAERASSVRPGEAGRAAGPLARSTGRARPTSRAGRLRRGARGGPAADRAARRDARRLAAVEHRWRSSTSTVVPGATSAPAAGEVAQARFGPLRKASKKPPPSTVCTSRPPAFSAAVASSTVRPTTSGTVTRERRVTRTTRHAGRARGATAATSMRFGPSWRATVVLKRPPLTATRWPSTTTRAPGVPTVPATVAVAPVVRLTSGRAGHLQRDGRPRGGRGRGAAAPGRRDGRDGEQREEAQRTHGTALRLARTRARRARPQRVRSRSRRSS